MSIYGYLHQADLCAVVNN